MSVIIRPRPQWGDWVALDTDDQPITDFSSISHAHLFAEGIRYVHGNIYHTILPCCQSSSQAPYASARDSAREVIQLAVNDIARQIGRWPHYPGLLRSIYHGHTRSRRPPRGRSVCDHDHSRKDQDTYERSKTQPML
jgi:hypothetical protein